MTTSSLEDTQRSIETDSVKSGVARYRDKVRRLQSKGLESTTDPSTHLMRVFIEPVSRALVQWVIDARRKPGRRAAALPLIEQMDPDVAAVITLRTVLNVVSQSRSYQQVAIAVGAALEDEQRMMAFEATQPGVYKRLTEYLKDSPLGFNPSYRRRVAVHTANKFNVIWQSWSHDAKLHVGSACIDMVIQHTGMVEMAQTTGRTVAQNRVILAPTQKMSEWLDQQHTRCEMLHPARLPMVCPPVPWTSTREGGYLTPGLRYPLIRGKTDGIESLLGPAAMPTVYAAANAAQAVPFTLNTPVLDVLLHLWEHGQGIPGAASRTDQPIPPKPADYATDPQAWRDWKQASREVFMSNRAELGKRLQTANTLSIANRYRNDTIWFPVMLDFRGRVYYTPQYLNPQGSDVARGLLLFGNGVALGPDGLAWLKRHVANCYGIDKANVNDRLAWVDQNLQALCAVAQDPYANRMWHDADKPVQFLSACIDLTAALASGDPASYISHLPVMVDGSCNGIQHLAAMSKDAAAGELVNLVPGPKPRDIYAEVAAETVACLRNLSQSSSPSSSCPTQSQSAGPSSPAALAAAWLAHGVDRSTTKRSTMIQPYNGTMVAMEEYIDAQLVEEGRTKPHPFGRDRRRASRLLARTMRDAMQSLMAGPVAVMSWTKDIARASTKAGKALLWQTPSGFHVRQARTDMTSRVVKTRLGGRITKLTLASASDKLSSRRQSQAFAPNFIHSMDAAMLHIVIHELAQRAITDTLSVHDAYGTHAGNMSVMAPLLRETFVSMYRQPVLERLAEHTLGPDWEKRVGPPPIVGTLDIETTLGSTYTFD